jgi:dihydrodipicolinate synthase/N-acetylneuraminate lyase
MPEVLRHVFDKHRAGDRANAVTLYERHLPLINFENKQCGLMAAKALMQAGGIISCEAPRHPLRRLHPAIRAGLVEMARRLDVLAMQWAR